MIKLNNINFGYPSGEFRLSIPELSVRTGEKVAVIGPSGSGKTTLLNMVAGILMPESGQVHVAGIELEEKNDQARRDFRISTIGFIFQDFGLIEYLDVLDNILHPYRINSSLSITREVKTKALQLADHLGVGSRLKHYPAKLSHGEQQRVAICRALLPGPRLLLADEATGNLDPGNKQLIIDLLFQAVQLHKTTLLSVTHDYELLSRFDRVIDFQDFLDTRREPIHG